MDCWEFVTEWEPESLRLFFRNNKIYLKLQSNHIIRNLFYCHYFNWLASCFCCLVQKIHQINKNKVLNNLHYIYASSAEFKLHILNNECVHNIACHFNTGEFDSSNIPLKLKKANLDHDKNVYKFKTAYQQIRSC